MCPESSLLAIETGVPNHPAIISVPKKWDEDDGDQWSTFFGAVIYIDLSASPWIDWPTSTRRAHARGLLQNGEGEGSGWRLPQYSS